MSTIENQAAFLTAVKARPLQVGPAPMPTPQGSEVVVQVHSAALNPVDPAIQNMGILVPADGYPYVLGFDFAGVVHAVGPDNTRFKVGDRVTALRAQGSAHGGFQLYAIPSIATKIPDHVSFNEGSVLGLGMTSAAYSLFEKTTLALDLPKPGGNKPNGKVLLVWGGASSVGACAIQLAKAAGYTIAATASAKNFDLLREIGAEHVFDYNKDGVVDDIVDTLKDKGDMAGVFSAIARPDSVLLQCAVISGRLEGKRHVGTVRPVGFPPVANWPEQIEVSDCMPRESFQSGVVPAIWGDWLEGALADGTMKCRPQFEVVGRGLDAVQGAVDLMGKSVSGKKLVVEMV
ncbi:chaperonin 10-like protein [Roridomyces roridus]|uniref:Chaperonin 10-like protein n=1 Tax=Roridomyces roridus TaxID=1738132 RepID=A0AAD7BR92_9AGAR|nr:chaperonin 10-like protein [Roridomyces roridus]